MENFIGKIKKKKKSITGRVSQKQQIRGYLGYDQYPVEGFLPIHQLPVLRHLPTQYLLSRYNK